jgi:alpha-1,6-mannosyltransferase
VNATGWLLPAGPLRRLQLLGFVSASALAVGGIGAGAVPKTGAKDVIAGELHLLVLRQTAGWRTACTIASFFALLGLLGAWAVVGRVLARCSTRDVLVLCVSWALPLLVAPPLFSADIYAYAGQGHLVVNHLDPYLYGPGDFEPTSKWSFNVDGVWRFSPAPYGPLWLWLTGRAVGIPENHLVVSIYVIRGLAVVGFVLMAWSVHRLSKLIGIPPERALWLTMLNPLLLLHGLAGAHNDILMTGLLVAGLTVAAVHPGVRGLVAGSALVTLAVLIKAPAIVALPFVPLLSPRQQRRWVPLAIGAVTAGVVAEGIALLTRLGWGWVGVLGRQGEHPSVWSLAWGVRRASSATTRAVLGAPAGDVVDSAVEALFLALLAIVLTALWLRAFRGRLDPVTGAGLALLAVFVLSFSAQPWYLAWGLVPLACTSTRRRAALLAASSGALCLYLLPGGRSWIRPPMFGLPVVLAFLVGLAVVRWFSQPAAAPVEAPGYAEVAAE